jgi:hypothetical protein
MEICEIGMKISIRTLFVLLLFAGVFLIAFKPIVDPDFWWHIKTGQLIVNTSSIPHFDMFSYSANGNQWIAHEWLSEVFMYGIYQLGGNFLSVLVFSIIITISFILVYLRCPKGSKPYVAGFVLLLGAIMSTPIWGVRPQVLTILNSSIFLFCLDQFKQKRKLKFLVPLPFVSLLWANEHGGFILGIGIIAIYLFSNVVDSIINICQTKNSIRSIFTNYLWILSGTLMICLLLTIINPNGIRILIYPFQTVNDASIQQFIQEWESPDFHERMWKPLALMIFLLIGSGMISRKRIATESILLCMVLGFATLVSLRHVPIFSLITIPVLAQQISFLIRIGEERTPLNRFSRWLIPIILGAVLFVVVLTFTQFKSKQLRTESEVFPKQAVDWITRNKPEGNVFNTYNWGGYLIWRLYPDYLVYVDGRCDMYGAKFISNYVDIYWAKPGWELQLRQNDVNLVLLEKDTFLSNALRLSPSWNISYEDEISVLFTRNQP